MTVSFVFSRTLGHLFCSCVNERTGRTLFTVKTADKRDAMRIAKRRGYRWHPINGIRT